MVYLKMESEGRMRRVGEREREDEEGWRVGEEGWRRLDRVLELGRVEERERGRGRHEGSF